ncbi:MAG: DNA polymerase III subunit alpha [Alphaproteobacteria bacterium]|nr:DNA polymerase III subunit alpha [Alphaproteobacteria bacterium]MBN2779790.1 DNA polymerase III subunit alpha [Alphaproteobacteria bacterium]
MDTTRFIHLRVHSSYSLCEGAIHLKKLPSLCEDLSMPAVAVTDTNTLFGAPLFSKVCLGAGVQPILGIQVDVGLVPQKKRGFSRPATQEIPTGQLVLLVQNETGYNTLNKLISAGYLENDTFRLTLDKLSEFNDGLICLTGGHRGVLGKLLLENRTDEAQKILLNLKAIFKDRLYVEVQRHGLPEQYKTEPQFIEWAYQHTIPLIATNDVFFKHKSDYEAHDALLCVKDGRYVDEDDRRKETKEHYFKSQEEMITLFSDMPEAIANTVQIAKRCGYAVPTRAPLLPHAYEDMNQSEDDILQDKVTRGLQKRLDVLGIVDTKPYFDQLAYELSVIKKMGFPGYFLIVSDFIKWSKYQGIPVGPGRGSGAGSVVSWALKITDINPHEYGLLFERFLNPDRISMPDFDVDFCQDRREEVIHYVQQKYGADKVAQIITFGELKARAVLRDVGRVLRMPYGHVDRLCKFIPGNPGDKTTLAEALQKEKALKEEYETDDIVKKLFDIAMILEGLHRHASVHAAGVVIGDRPLDQLVALYHDPRAEMPVTQYDMKFVEDTGLIKYDFLGLKTLSVIKQAVGMIKQNHTLEIDIDHIPLDDPKVYKTYAKGDTIGLFQFESTGMQESLKALQPTEFNDLIAMVSLYRPGPMENIPHYVARKHGKEDVTYLHELMAKALKETYGIIVYQEQVMEMSKVLAGFTGGQADTLRKAMGKKIQSLMDQLKPLFVEGCSKNGIPTDTSTQIWELMEKFASYGFNKSHAVCYALISYQTGYLKTYYRPEFIAASMNYDLNNTDKLVIFVADAKKYKMQIVPPNVNTSEALFAAKEGKVYYALGALKNVGVDAMRRVVAERNENGPFKSVPDFLARVNPKDVNKRTLENLIKSGAFDTLDADRATLLANVNLLLANMGSVYLQKETGETSLFGVSENIPNAPAPSFYQNMKKAEPLSIIETIRGEHETLGFYITTHPLRRFSKLFKKMTIQSSKDFADLADGQTVRLPVFVDSFTVRRTKKDTKMGILKASDSFNEFEILFFSRELEHVLTFLKEKTAMLLTANVKKDGDSISLFGRSAEPLMRHIFQCLTTVTLPIKDKSVLPKIAPELAKAKKGYTNVILNIQSGGKISTMRLPQKVLLTEEIFETVEKYVPELELK